MKSAISFLLLLCALAPLLAHAQNFKWHQLGKPIGRENVFDDGGTSIASSSNGLTVAVGSPKHSADDDSADNRTGRVRVFYFEPTHDIWQQLGQDLVGDNYDQAGSSVGLSDDGKIIAVGSKYHSYDDKINRGCVRIYQLQNVEEPAEPSDDDEGNLKTEWVQLGQTIFGIDAFELFGSSLAIEGDGEALIVGAPNSPTNGVESGKAYVYVYIESAKEWQLVGEPIEGVEQSRLGTSVSISDDGFTIAVGAPKHGEKRSGQAQVYHYDDSTSKWEREAEFLGNYDGDECGTSVGLNPKTATYLAIGCPLHNKNQNPANYHSGRVIIKKRDTADSDWSDGGSLDGDNANDEFGYALSMGFESRPFLAVGSPKYTREEAFEAGRVRVFHYIEDTWKGKGLDVTGTEPFDHFGSSVSIGFDGHRIVAGAPDNVGYATAYELSYTAPPTFAPTSDNSSTAAISIAYVLFITFMCIISIVLLYGVYKGIQYIRSNHFNSDSANEVEFTQVITTETPSSNQGRDII